MNNPLFESHANATIERVRATYSQRGGEYGDTWRNCQWLALKAAARKLGVQIPDKFLTAIAAAVLVDVKYQRLEGGYKDDSVVDGIAYQALWAQEMGIQTTNNHMVEMFSTAQVGVFGARNGHNLAAHTRTEEPAATTTVCRNGDSVRDQ